MKLHALTIALFLLAAPGWAQDAGDRYVMKLFSDAADPDGPGCALSVTRAGATLLERVWGKAHLEQPAPVTLETVFEAGSVSKQFTAAAIAVLIDKGALGLDDPVRHYLPEFRAHDRPVTVRMLLTHTSGLRNWDDLVELAGRPREDASGARQADIIALIARQSGLNFTPGSEYLYSNSNYVLLAAIVERVAKETFEAFSQRELFGPIGMSHTQWRTDYTAVIKGRATAYTPDETGILHIDMPMEDVVGPGGLLTTIGDLQRWNAFLANPPEAARRWVGLLTLTVGNLSDGSAISYGFGLEHDQTEGQAIRSHAGATAGYRAYLGYAPDQGLSAAVLCNAGALNTEEIGGQLMALFLPPAIAQPPASLSPRGAPADLAGRYRNVRTGALVVLSVDAAGAHFNDGQAFTLHSEAKLVSADGTRTAIVARDKKGAVAGIRLSRIGNSDVELVPVAVWTPTASEVSDFEGSYYSSDVGAVWRIRAEKGQLRATGPRGETFLLEPLYLNAFQAVDAYWTLHFERDARGRASAVSFTKTRTRNVRFVRQ